MKSSKMIAIKSCILIKIVKNIHLDLWQANAIILQRAGVLADNIDMANTCTACNKDVFFSYRADNGKTGRIASIISLR